MDWGAALTLVFAGIGAATGLLTFGNEVVKRRTERRALAEAAARQWSLSAEPNLEVNGWTLQVRYEAPQEAPTTLVSMCILEPPGAIASRAKVIRTRGEGQPLVSADEVWSSAVDLDAEMTPSLLFGTGAGFQQSSYATRSIVCRLSKSTKAGKIRFRASLTIEDNSAARRRSSFIVASQEIAWTASSADKTT